MSNGKFPEDRGIGRGCLIFVLLYGLSWAVALTGLFVVGVVITGLTALAGLVLVFVGPTTRDRGTGAGILIGAAVAALVFTGCVALIAQNL